VGLSAGLDTEAREKLYYTSVFIVTLQYDLLGLTLVSTPSCVAYLSLPSSILDISTVMFITITA
jgi:hypothetical protein